MTRAEIQDARTATDICHVLDLGSAVKVTCTPPEVDLPREVQPGTAVRHFTVRKDGVNPLWDLRSELRAYVGGHPQSLDELHASIPAVYGDGNPYGQMRVSEISTYPA